MGSTEWRRYELLCRIAVSPHGRHPNGVTMDIAFGMRTSALTIRTFAADEYPCDTPLIQGMVKASMSC